MPRMILSVFLGLILLGFTQAGTAEAAKPKEFKFSFFKPAVSKPVIAKGDVKVEISRDAQKMNVYVAGQLKHTWPVSTGRKGFKTPRGAFKPTWMTKMWHSKQWHNAPMPHSVFFKEGYAIHATYETGKLGRPASHGCVRLAPQNAAKLFTIIKTHGEKKTRIVVS
ncbi:MAG: L,D-transpeptidase [Hyphomicrobium sp.]